MLNSSYSTTFGLDPRKMVNGIFASLAENEGQMIPEQTKAGHLLAKAKEKQVGRSSGADQVNFLEVKRGLGKGLSFS